MSKTKIAALTVLASVALSACTMGGHQTADYDKMTADIVKASFIDRGIAKVDRLEQDASNKACAEADVAGVDLAKVKVGAFFGDDPVVSGSGVVMGSYPAKDIEAAEMKTIKWPSDGKFLGDWKEGEKVAQSGRGLTWSDKAEQVNGGNCYNCHQISKEEISFGTIGPSLYNYGKLRGVSNPNSPEAKAIVEYTWGKLWNARAYNACSQMPRVGHKGILNEKQIKDVMALLLDPNSPVNQ